MSDDKVQLEIDYATNLVTIAFLRDVPDCEVKTCLINAFSEVPHAYRFDWLFDFSLLRQVLSVETAVETSREWERIAHGRDVGRRSAVMSADPRYKNLTENAQATMPFRLVSFFATRESALDWLKSVDGGAHNDGAQLI